MSSEQFRELPLSDVLLDASNPRLPRDVAADDLSQDELLRLMARHYHLAELAQSIADKGFAPRQAEALLAIADPDHPGKFTVVEGNRRLATLKLLSDPRARRVAGVRENEWESLASAATEFELSTVPVIVYPDREALNTYLGFRHITGPKQWRPEAKARFIAHLLRGNEEIGSVARRIGSNHRTVRRLAEAHAVYSQALAANISVDGIEQGFGVFYNALSEPGIRTFLGLSPQKDINSLPVDPVAEQNLDRLSDLVSLLFGDSDQQVQSVIAESRELRKLGSVLVNDTACANLMRDRNLDRAWRLGGGGRQEFIALLIDLRARLGEVSGQSVIYSTDSDIVDHVATIYQVAKDMAKRYGVDDNES